MTTIFTPSPVRDDVLRTSESASVTPTSAATASATDQSTLWAASGVAAAVTGLGALVSMFRMDGVYNPATAGDAEKILDRMIDLKLDSSVFHLLASATALLLVPFAAGLYRRLRGSLPTDSLLPGVAAIGVAITSVVLVMGSGLDTEFGFGLPGKGFVVPESVAFYNHWIGTIPYLWTGVGLAGLAVAAAAWRHRAVPRWLGVVGLLLGGLTVLTGISPLAYMAGMVGPLWLLVTAIGFLVGDRNHRR